MDLLTDLGRLIYKFPFAKKIVLVIFSLSNVEFSQKSKFRDSNMTKIADVDLQELRKLNLLKKSECHKVKIWEF